MQVPHQQDIHCYIDIMNHNCKPLRRDFWVPEARAAGETKPDTSHTKGQEHVAKLL